MIVGIFLSPRNTYDGRTSWLSALALAEAAGISDRAARKAMARARAGMCWRGCTLEIRKVRAGGGPQGLRYEVGLNSLPGELRDLMAANGNSSPAPCAIAIPSVDSSLPAKATTSPSPVPAKTGIPPVHRPTVTMDEETAWRLALIQPIRRGSEPCSAERGAMIQAVAGQEHTDWTGRRITVSERSLREWIARYEVKGLAGLGRRCREDRGRRRVALGRDWDKAVAAAGAPETDIAAAVEDIRTRIASLWRSGAPSWPNVRILTAPYIMERTRKIAPAMPEDVLRTISQLPRPAIEAGRAFGIVATKEKDAKGYKDKFTPRIHRDRSGLKPMDWVAGDVKHCDVAFTRDDGSICTPKMVAFPASLLRGNQRLSSAKRRQVRSL